MRRLIISAKRKCGRDWGRGDMKEIQIFHI